MTKMPFLIWNLYRKLNECNMIKCWFFVGHKGFTFYLKKSIA